MRKKVLRSALVAGLSVALVFQMMGCGKETATTEATTKEAVTEATEATPEDATDTTEDVEVAEGGNLITNGDFSNGIEEWFTYCENGVGEISVNSDGELDLKVSDIGTVEHGVQIYHDGFALDEGCVYKLTFDARSEKERPVEMRFQINGGDYHAYYKEIVELGTETQSYEYTFTMSETSDPAPRFCFNTGLVEGIDEGIGEHHIFFDNFVLTLEDDSNKVAGAGEIEVPDIAVNQIGYLPGSTKTATIMGDALNSDVKLVDEKTGEAVLEEKVGAGTDDPDTGEKEAVFDFSSVKDEGTYHVESGDIVSASFKIGEDVYEEAFKASIKMLYYQRCGTELSSDLAGDFAHPVCHADKAVLYEDNSKTLDVSGGWHDAGDYGRYPVAGAKAAADILLAYENYPDVFDDEVGIPESGNGTPDILDEARYELDWLLKMQSDDGGVYHKVTCKTFPNEVMPEEETDQLVVMPVSTTATADFAAVMSIASRVYADSDKAYADKCLAAAKKAAEYLQKTPRDTKGYKNPSDVTTGEYEDVNDVDERFWAYAELFKTTGDKSYEDAMKKELPDNGYSLGWQGVAGYGGYAYLTADGADAGTKDTVKKEAEAMCKDIVDNTNSYSYGSSIVGTYPWGSNMTIANNGEFVLMMKDVLGSDNKTVADKQLNYLFGNNATGYCFLTGFGAISPEHPHHRPSQATGKAVPGMLSGGPDSNLEDPFVQNVLKDTPAAKCYADNSQSYSTNEVTIYWNSPLIYLMAGELANTK